MFKEPSRSVPEEVCAHLDWLRTFNNDLMMPEAYKEGADFLVEALRLGGDGSHPDRFTFPILYLYRHATELKMKDLIKIGLRLKFTQPSEKVDAMLSGHTLYPLWNCVRSILEQGWPNEDRKILLAVEGMISELHQTDKDGQHLRYSHDKSGEPFDHQLPDRIDLLNLRDTFDGLWNFFQGCADGLRHLEDN